MKRWCSRYYTKAGVVGIGSTFLILLFTLVSLKILRELSLVEANNAFGLFMLFFLVGPLMIGSQVVAFVIFILSEKLQGPFFAFVLGALVSPLMVYVFYSSEEAIILSAITFVMSLSQSVICLFYFKRQLTDVTTFEKN